MTHLSVYKNSSDTTGVTVSLEAVINRITSGNKGLAEKTHMCRILKQTDPPAYDAYKNSELPAAIFAGMFPQKRGMRKAKHLVQHSGYIVLDIDGLTDTQIPDVLSEFAQHPYIRLAFVSPSGKGIKAVVKVDPVPRNDMEHKGAWQACVDFFDDLTDEYRFEIDTTGKDCSRLCYLAHDAHAIIHENVPAIEWDKDAWLTEQAERQQRLEAASANFKGEADLAALDYIPNDCDYETWRNIGMAIKHAGFGVDVFQKWTGGRRKRSTGEWVDEDILSHWGRFNRSTGSIVTWGTVVFIAKENGYKPAPKLRPPKLTRTPPAQHSRSDTASSTAQHA